MSQAISTIKNNNVKRLVLVVDDEEINREMLGMILGDDYNIIFASDGVDALEQIRSNVRLLSVVLLDLLMPKMSGTELLRVMKEDPELARIPVIVLTSERAAEVESLRNGAADFIPKPYDMPEVIKARVRRTIELNEDRQLIETTEYDELTGLYTRKFFYRYADQFDKYHPDEPTDALYMNISRFHLINNLYGRPFGDKVLHIIADILKRAAESLGGVAGRSEGDRFILYLPKGLDYSALTGEITSSVSEINKIGIRIDFGIYPDCDKSLDIEERVYRAKLAANKPAGYGQSYSVYDDSMHEKELYNEKLVEELDKALEEKQFKVFYQPKYNIQGDKPVLSSAEALVRWFHPDLGMISPGVFIPLFENSGLIQKVDKFVWGEAAKQIRKWKDRFGVTLPVSVNVSRIDMFNPDLTDILKGIVESSGIDMKDLLLEITESAYTDDSAQILGVVNSFREAGFLVEMDDFGSGYSSLNMITELPIDALKLDMVFIRHMTDGEKNVHMLKLMIDIAKYLGVPVIAEGVETKEQLDILKKLGCDLVQGYYFSKPVPDTEFEKLIERE